MHKMHNNGNIMHLIDIEVSFKKALVVSEVLDEIWL